MEEQDERFMELESVEAIFPELVRHGPSTVSLEIPVPLSKPVCVVFPALPQPAPVSLYEERAQSEAPDEQQDEIHYLWNLPPLKATITLPDGYPSEKGPEVEIAPQEEWMPQSKLDELRAAAGKLWEDIGHDMIVYSYVEHIQDAAANCFDLAVDGVLDVPLQLKVALLDYDQKVKKEQFDRETFDCSMCLEPKKGVVCYRLVGCGHVFCVECLQDYYNNCITEGDVDNVRCINPDCGKDADTHAHGQKQRKRPKKLQPNELLQISISEEQVQRYIKMRRKKKFESNPKTVYCPRTWCQGPARVGNESLSDGDDSESENEGDNAEDGQEHPPAPAAQGEDADNGGDDHDDDSVSEAPRPVIPPVGERLAVCLDCDFAFCVICKKTWHGEHGWCSVRSQNALSREERASEDYLKKYSTPCPYCNVRCQKAMGCNHMRCRQCGTHFCYLCSSWLVPSNPYIHFNTAGGLCYQRLWDLEGGDGTGAPARPEPPPIEVIFEEDPIPEADNVNVPAPAPVPERREPARRNAPARARVPPQAPDPPRPIGGNRARRGVQRGPARPEPPQPIMAGHGLQRFLELAARDEEDGWDSDELDDIDDEMIQFMLRD